MSNFYAKAINPRTHQEEDCTFIDNGKDTFIEFKDGWKYNTKFFNSPISEQEAINQDGEETIEQFDKIFSREEDWDNHYSLNPDAYDKNSRTQKAFGVSSDGDEDYPDFFDFAFNWKWKLLFWILSIGLITSPLVVGYLLVAYFFKV